MALNAQVGTITQPGATGNETYDLPDDFDPKALILWTVARDATGGGSAHAVLCFGMATDRGGTPQQRWTMFASEDNAATSDVYVGQGTADIIKLTNGLDATVDLEVAFVEFLSGSSSAFVLNWQNLHTSTVLINYVVLGGDGVQDALVDQIGLSGATQDETVTAGFGQPDLVIWPLSWHGGDPPATANGDTNIGFGVRDSGANGRAIRIGSTDNAATQAAFQASKNNRAVALGNNGAEETTVAMGASAGWPTDGFEISTTGSTGFDIPYMAIRFSADVTVTHGQGAAPTSGGLPVVQTLTSADTPKLLFILNARTATANTVDSSSTDCMMVGIGAADGAGNETWAGISDDDAQGTASVNGTYQSTTKAIQYWTSSANALDAEADALINGSDFELSWNDVAPTAFLYQWFALGTAGAGGGTVDLEGAIASASSVSGSLTVAKDIAGAVSSASTVAGTLTVSGGLSGAVSSASTVSGALSIASPLAGTVTSASTVSGALSVTKNLSGAVASTSAVSGTLTNTAPGDIDLAGAISATSTVAGTLTVTAALAAAVVSASTVSGTLTNTAPGSSPLAGTISSTSTVTGTLLVTKPLAGAIAAASTVSGNLTVPKPLAGTVASASSVSGALQIRSPLTGAVASASAVTGHVTVLRPLQGVIAAASAVTASLTNQGPVTAVARLEDGAAVTFGESTSSVNGIESTSGVTALIE